MDEAGEPLPDANVYLTDLSVGTFTDNKGKFKLQQVSTSNNNVLCISYVGYEKVFKAIGQGENHFQVQMEPAAVLLDAVVIRPAPDQLASDLIAVIEESEDKNSALSKVYIRLFEVDKDFEVLSRAFEIYLDQQAFIK